MQKSPDHRVKHLSVPFEDILKKLVFPANRPHALCGGGSELDFLFSPLKLQKLPKCLGPISFLYYKKALERTLNFVFNQNMMLL